ncbi:hypothetical protein BVX98_00910 [bacterium F11]|nr:hypothetical protein BVX98_00910 [bacterium F11]
MERKKEYNLDERTFLFAQNVRNLISHIQIHPSFPDDKNQVIRASGSVGANYIEANEGLSTRDFIMRIKICRKEAKESHYWLRLMRNCIKEEEKPKADKLIQESLELAKIFGAIVKKCEGRFLEERKI